MVGWLFERILCRLLGHEWHNGPTSIYCSFCEKTKKYRELPYDVYYEARENGDIVFKMKVK